MYIVMKTVVAYIPKGNACKYALSYSQRKKLAQNTIKNKSEHSCIVGRKEARGEGGGDIHVYKYIYVSSVSDNSQKRNFKHSTSWNWWKNQPVRVHGKFMMAAVERKVHCVGYIGGRLHVKNETM